MLCDICHKNQAHIFRTEIINGERKEQHLCESCASEFLAFSIKDGQGNEIPIGTILSGLLASCAESISNDAGKPQPTCPCCGMSLMQFQKASKLGCPKCYETFSKLLDKNLTTLHGSLEYRGKHPVNGSNRTAAGRTMDEAAGRAADPVQAPSAASAQASSAAPVQTPAAASAQASSAAPIQTVSAASEQAVSAASAQASRSKRKSSERAGRRSSAPENTDDMTVDELKSRMAAAVDEEDYEQAARFRDLIHAREDSAHA